jgi:DNA modification methylase
VAALRNGRRFLGIEKQENFAKRAARRLKKVKGR